MKAMVGGCCVCSDERGWTENPLVYCDGQGCNVAVHQACYGIISVPSGPWYCKKCESTERAVRVRCELCPQKDGALKRTESGGWCHVVCALYIPEAWFLNVETMEPIVLKSVPQDRFIKSCYICEEKKNDATKNCYGACMQCNKPGCRQFFHVTCAQSQGLLCEETFSEDDSVKYIAYCAYHYKKMKKDVNIKIIPAFKPIPADNATPDTTPEKYKNGPFDREKISRSGGSINSETSNTSAETEDEKEKFNTTKKEASKDSQPLTDHASSQEMSAVNTSSHKPKRRLRSSKTRHPSSSSLPVSSEKDSHLDLKSSPGCSENLFTAQSRAGSNNGLFGAGAACSSKVSASQCGSGSVSQSVIMANENGPSTSGAESNLAAVAGLKTSLSRSSSVDSTGATQLQPKSQKRRGRKPKKSTQSVADKSSKALSDGHFGDNKVRNDGLLILADVASDSRLPGKTGSVFGGDPFFQSPLSMTSFSGSADGEKVNGTLPFPCPLSPKPTQLTNNIDADPGKFPTSLTEFLQLQWEETAQFLMEQGEQFDVTVVLKQLHELKSENKALEDQVKTLAMHRDHLRSTNSQLAIPFTSVTKDKQVDPLPVEVSAANGVQNAMEIDSPSMPHYPLSTSASAPPMPYLPVKPSTIPILLQGTPKTRELFAYMPDSGVRDDGSTSTHKSKSQFVLVVGRGRGRGRPLRGQAGTSSTPRGQAGTSSTPRGQAGTSSTPRGQAGTSSTPRVQSTSATTHTQCLQGTQRHTGRQHVKDDSERETERERIIIVRKSKRSEDST